MIKLLLLLISTLSINSVYACKCAQTSFSEDAKSSEVIFKGRVHNILIREKEKVIIFISEKIWKGQHQDTFFLSTGLDQASCELEVKLGEVYIVFSSNNSVNICSRTRLARKQDEIRLNFLFSDLDQTDSINKAESEYFMALTRSKNSFQNKKVVFTLNHKIITKDYWHKITFDYDNPAIQLLELNEKERKVYNVDFIFVAWSKQEVNDKIKYKILKQIK